MPQMLRPTQTELMNNALDITNPVHGVHVHIRGDGKVLWVNVDGVCTLRICQIERLDIEDERNVPV